jgi:hypothetical protein
VSQKRSDPLTDHEQFGQDEKRILQVLSKGLSTGFRNPSRLGCPSAAILEGIASRRITLFESEPWLDHLGSCSACFAEFTAIRQRLHTRRQITVASVLAIVTVISALWFSVQSHFSRLDNQTTVLDLRGYSIERGHESSADRQPLLVGTGTRHVVLYLPMGSKDGHYDLVLLKETGEELLQTKGIAQLENHTVILKADVSLSSLPRHSYFFGVRQNGTELIRFPIRVR